MNPYDFVPYPGAGEIDHATPAGHDTFAGLSGRIVCALEALSPFLVMSSHHRAGSQRSMVGLFLQDEDGAYIIPGASLKGMIRSVYEVLMPSCLSTSSGKTKDLVPSYLATCRHRDQLCPACRVFGAMGRGRNAWVHRGHVNIGQAVIQGEAQVLPDVQMVPLSTPQPHHEAFYKPGGQPAGLKFYFHHHHVSKAANENERARGPWVALLADRTAEGTPGATFRFSVFFRNLQAHDLEGLMAALTLSDTAPWTATR